MRKMDTSMKTHCALLLAGVTPVFLDGLRWISWLTIGLIYEGGLSTKNFQINPTLTLLFDNFQNPPVCKGQGWIVKGGRICSLRLAIPFEDPTFWTSVQADGVLVQCGRVYLVVDVLDQTLHLSARFKSDQSPPTIHEALKSPLIPSVKAMVTWAVHFVTVVNYKKRGNWKNCWNPKWCRVGGKQLWNGFCSQKKQ